MTRTSIPPHTGSFSLLTLLLGRLALTVPLALVLILGGCWWGGGEDPVATELEVSGGGAFTVVAGSSFQSFVIATESGGDPIFTVKSVTPPPGGPALANVLVNNQTQKGLVTADVPVGYVGPSTITVQVAESTATASREVALTLDGLQLDQVDLEFAAADGSVSLVCTWPDFVGVIFNGPAGFLPAGTAVEFVTTASGSIQGVDKLGIRIGDQPLQASQVTLPAALFPGGVLPSNLDTLMASPFDGSMWDMAAVTQAGEDAEVTIPASSFGAGVPAVGGGMDYGTLLDFVGLAAGASESAFSWGYDFSWGATAGILLTGDPYADDSIVASVEIVVENGVVNNSLTDWPALEATLDGLDDLIILVPGFKLLWSGQTHKDWYSTDDDDRDALTTWLLRRADDPCTPGKWGGVLVIAYNTHQSLDEDWGWLGHEEGSGTVNSVINLVAYLTNGQWPSASDRTYDVVCHSMGGLVARDALMQSASFRGYVERFVTLATPHRGTNWGGVSMTQGGWDMDTGSDYMAYINESPDWESLVVGATGVDAWALWRSDDWVVSSQSSGLHGWYRTQRLLIDGSGAGGGSGHSGIHENLETPFPIHTGTNDVNENPEGGPSVQQSVGTALRGILRGPSLADDFENYAMGGWAAPCWVRDGNASDSGNNGIRQDPLNPGTQTLQLFGALGSCWGALAYHPWDFSERFMLTVRVYHGGEPRTGCHPDGATIGMRRGTYWGNPSRMLLQFNGDGTLSGGGQLLPGSYQPGQWYNVRVMYDRIGSDLTLDYWLDGVNIGAQQLTITSLEAELALDHFELAAQEGTCYFDDLTLTNL